MFRQFLLGLMVPWLCSCSLLFSPAGSDGDIDGGNTVDSGSDIDGGEAPRPQLSSLALAEPYSVAPDFVFDQYSYQVEVSALPLLDVIPSTVDANASISVNGQPVGSGMPTQVKLASGENNIDISVMSGNGISQSYALTVNRGGAPLEQMAYVKAHNTDSDDQFGSQLALSGDTLAVGVPREDSSSVGINSTPNDDQTDSGAVYIYRRINDQWQQEAYIKGTDIDERDYFGSAVALYGDILVVGAERQGIVGTAIGPGAVYVFRRNGTDWTQEAMLTASNPDIYDEFGASVAVHGSVIAIGAPSEDAADSSDTATAADSGAVYLFRHDGSTWLQEEYLKGPTPAQYDNFGAAVSLSNGLVAVAAPRRDNSNSVQDHGAVYIYSNTGADWTQTCLLFPAINSGSAQDKLMFGSQVSLHGTTLAASGYFEDNFSSDNAGGVYLYEDATNCSQPGMRIEASNASGGDRFGASISLYEDVLVVGAPWEDSNSSGIDGAQEPATTTNTGAAYFFTRGDSGWSQYNYIKASNPDGNDRFGASVALSGDSLAIGAFREGSDATGTDGDQESNDSSNSGAIYIFR